MRIVSVAEMTAIEKKANAGGLGYDQMMRNAGSSLAETVAMRYGQLEKRHVLGLIGSGNNGGDTLIALKLLQGAGWKITALLVKDRSANDPLVGSVMKVGGEVIKLAEEVDDARIKHKLRECSVVLDGVLGTGFKLPLRGTIPDILKLTAEYAVNAHIVAVDCPSGVDCDSGACAPEVLQAEITVCMAAVKQGLLQMPALGLVGEIVPAKIGLAENALDSIESGTLMVDSGMVSSLLPNRPADAHKGTFGMCMVAGGSVRYPGAPLLAARAAYRTGAGLVCTAIPSAIFDGSIGSLPESIWLKLPHEMGCLNADAAKVIIENSGKSDVILVGPGLCFERSTEEFMQQMLAFNGPTKREKLIGFVTEQSEAQIEKVHQPIFVIDADALRMLPKIDGWPKLMKNTAVLTPHPGEMATLTGLTVDDIQANRIETARKYAAEIGHVVVLKGAGTVIASAQGETAMAPFATSALATAGSGDVLAGVIAGLIAQGLTAFEGAITGVWLHGAAGLAASRSLGQAASVIAGDIVDHLPAVLKQITAR